MKRRLRFLSFVMAVSVVQPNVNFNLGVQQSLVSEQTKVTSQNYEKIQMMEEKQMLESSETKMLASVNEFKQADLKALKEQELTSTDKTEKAQIQKEIAIVNKLNTLEDFADFNLKEAQLEEDAYVFKTVDEAVEYIKKEDSIYADDEDVKLSSVTTENQYIDQEFINVCKQVEQYKNSHKDTKCVDTVEYMESKQKSVLKMNSGSLMNLNTGVFDGMVIEASLQNIIDGWKNLTKAEKILVCADPIHALIAKACAKKAENWTKSEFGYSGMGDKSDAYRHGIWNALMTRASNRYWAKAFASAHEDIPSSDYSKVESDGFTKAEHRSMDLHNNEIGRSVIKWYHFRFTCKDKKVKSLIKGKLNNNRSSGLYWLHEKGKTKADTQSSSTGSQSTGGGRGSATVTRRDDDSNRDTGNREKGYQLAQRYIDE